MSPHRGRPLPYVLTPLWVPPLCAIPSYSAPPGSPSHPAPPLPGEPQASVPSPIPTPSSPLSDLASQSFLRRYFQIQEQLTWVSHPCFLTLPMTLSLPASVPVRQSGVSGPSHRSPQVTSLEPQPWVPSTGPTSDQQTDPSLACGLGSRMLALPLWGARQVQLRGRWQDPQVLPRPVETHKSHKSCLSSVSLLGSLLAALHRMFQTLPSWQKGTSALSLTSGLGGLFCPLLRVPVTVKSPQGCWPPARQPGPDPGGHLTGGHLSGGH